MHIAVMPPNELHSCGASQDALGVSPHTVRNHIASILAKLRLDTRVQAAVEATGAGIA